MLFMLINSCAQRPRAPPAPSTHRASRCPRSCRRWCGGACWGRCGCSGAGALQSCGGWEKEYKPGLKPGLLAHDGSAAGHTFILLNPAGIKAHCSTAQVTWTAAAPAPRIPAPLYPPRGVKPALFLPPAILPGVPWVVYLLGALWMCLGRGPAQRAGSAEGGEL